MAAAADAASKSSAIKTGKEVILFACLFIVQKQTKF